MCITLIIIMMNERKEIVSPEEIIEAELSPCKMNKTTIEFSNSDLPNEARDSDRLMQNRSLRHSSGFKPKGGQRSKEFVQLGNACPVNSSKKDISLYGQFRHPWALTVKPRSIHIKTDRNRRNSTEVMSQRVATDHVKDQKVIHSLRVKQDKIIKKVPLFDKQHKHLLLKTDHKKWSRLIKQQNLLKRQMEEKELERQSQEDLIDVVNKKEAEAKKQRQRKRQNILEQRMKKQKAVENVHKEKADYAFRQRLASYELKTQRREVEDYEMYEKRLLYQRQKQEKFIKKQQRRPQSQSHSKWISDFHTASKDKPTLTEKQQAFAQKMKLAIISLSQRNSPS